MKAHTQLNRSAILGRLPNQALPIVTKASGFSLYDAAGKQYLDGISGAYAAILGYNDRELNECMTETAASLSYVHSARFSNIYAEQLAERLSTTLDGMKYRCYFSVSGSDGVEAALRIARSYHQSIGSSERVRSVGQAYSYHGSTFGALSVTGHRTARRSYETMLTETIRLMPPVTAPWLGGDEEDKQRSFLDLENAFSTNAANEISAFVIEPVLGNAAGCAPIPLDYAEKVSATCRAHGALLIADEVTTGLWRTGPAYGSQLLGLKPDMVVVGKAITSGYFPMSVVLVAEHVADALTGDVNLLGHTHSAHPIGAALGLRVLERLESTDARSNRVDLDAALSTRLSQLAGDGPVLGVRGIGLLRAISFDTEYFRRRYGKLGSSVVYERALTAGALTMPGASLSPEEEVVSDHIMLAPAHAMDQTTLHEFFNRLSSAISTV